MNTDSILHAVSIRNLVKSYGDLPVLKGVNLDIKPGEILGYIGPNGAGKTTTVKILIGMLEEFEGEASVAGHDVRSNPLEVKQHIGYVPESAALYEALTPMEFLLFIGRIHGMPDSKIDGRARKLLELFDLGENLDSRMSSFSKGMRQKVLIIAGMIHDPDVLFLDEPLTGLDANTALTVKEIISGLSEAGKTVFYCSHVMDVVERVCHRIVILNKGEIVADGTFEELQEMSRRGSLESIFTQLTSDESQQAVASEFLEVITG